MCVNPGSPSDSVSRHLTSREAVQGLLDDEQRLRVVALQPNPLTFAVSDPRFVSLVRACRAFLS